MSKARPLFALATLGLVAGALFLLVPRCESQREVLPTAAPDSRNASSVVSASSVPPPAKAPSFSPRRIAKFDVHTHIDPEIAAPAREFLEAEGIGRVVNLSGGTPVEGLAETLAAAKANDPFYVVFANINFEDFGTAGWAAREVRELTRAKQMGARGVKIAKNLGLGVRYPDGRRAPVDDPAFDPLFDAMARLHLPLAIHTGDPKAFFDPMGADNERMEELAAHPAWSFADRSRFPTWEALYGEFERRVARSAKTTIIGVHFGNAPESPERVRKMLDQYPNFYVDTAARVPELGRKPAEVRSTILAHPDRVLFGTDVQLGAGMLVLGAGPARGHTKAGVEHFFTSSYRFFETADRGFAHPTPIQGRWTIDGIDLPPEILENVYHRNAERLLGLPPTPLVPGLPSSAGSER